MTPKLSGPTGQMEKGPIGTRRMEKGSSRDFYDELPTNGEKTMWRFMTKCHSLKIEYCLSQMCN